MPYNLTLYDLPYVFLSSGILDVIAWIKWYLDAWGRKGEFWDLSLFYGLMSMHKGEFGLYVDVMPFMDTYVIYVEWHFIWRFKSWDGYSFLNIVLVELSSFFVKT